MPSKPANGDQRGWIIPIGGAEDKDTNPRILERFVELSGGADADIVIIPTASRLKESGLNYHALFTAMGVARVEVMDFDTRRDAQEPNRVQRLSEASGIFFTGGNQLRLSTILGGTDIARAVRLASARGVTVAGTSAGAGILSEHMIAFGKEGSSPRASSVRLAPGLGLTNRFVIDQHFRQRDRLGRLTAALAYNPFAIGIGLDEDTAAFISPDDTLEVEGSGAVTVVDAHDLQFSSMAHADEDDPVCMLGLGVHILIAGATFNLHTRRASAGRLATRKT